MFRIDICLALLSWRGRQGNREERERGRGGTKLVSTSCCCMLLLVQHGRQAARRCCFAATEVNHGQGGSAAAALLGNVVVVAIWQRHVGSFLQGETCEAQHVTVPFSQQVGFK